jgi:hypothetical protein
VAEEFEEKSVTCLSKAPNLKNSGSVNKVKVMRKTFP